MVKKLLFSVFLTLPSFGYFIVGDVCKNVNNPNQSFRVSRTESHTTPIGACGQLLGCPDSVYSRGFCNTGSCIPFVTIYFDNASSSTNTPYCTTNGNNTCPSGSSENSLHLSCKSDSSSAVCSNGKCFDKNGNSLRSVSGAIKAFDGSGNALSSIPSSFTTPITDFSNPEPFLMLAGMESLGIGLALVTLPISVPALSSVALGYTLIAGGALGMGASYSLGFTTSSSALSQLTNEKMTMIDLYETTPVTVTKTPQTSATGTAVVKTTFNKSTDVSTSSSSKGLPTAYSDPSGNIKQIDLPNPNGGVKPVVPNATKDGFTDVTLTPSTLPYTVQTSPGDSIVTAPNGNFYIKQSTGAVYPVNVPTNSNPNVSYKPVYDSQSESYSVEPSSYSVSTPTLGGGSGSTSVSGPAGGTSGGGTGLVSTSSGTGATVTGDPNAKVSGSAGEGSETAGTFGNGFGDMNGADSSILTGAIDEYSTMVSNVMNDVNNAKQTFDNTKALLEGGFNFNSLPTNTDGCSMSAVIMGENIDFCSKLSKFGHSVSPIVYLLVSVGMVIGSIKIYIYALEA